MYMHTAGHRKIVHFFVIGFGMQPTYRAIGSYLWIHEKCNFTQRVKAGVLPPIYQFLLKRIQQINVQSLTLLNYERSNADSGCGPLDLVKYFETFFD